MKSYENSIVKRNHFYLQNILAGSLQTLIPSRDRLVKAKSETSLVSCGTLSQGLTTEGRSRSLEMPGGLPMWREDTIVVELLKGDHGLGFSILDYQVGKYSILFVEALFKAF